MGTNPELLSTELAPFMPPSLSQSADTLSSVSKRFQDQLIEFVEGQNPAVGMRQAVAPMLQELSQAELEFNSMWENHANNALVSWIDGIFDKVG